MLYAKSSCMFRSALCTCAYVSYSVLNFQTNANTNNNATCSISSWKNVEKNTDKIKNNTAHEMISLHLTYRIVNRVYYTEDYLSSAGKFQCDVWVYVWVWGKHELYYNFQKGVVVVSFLLSLNDLKCVIIRRPFKETFEIHFLVYL